VATTTSAPPATQQGLDESWWNYLPGVWVAAQPYGGDELWTFNNRSGAAGYGTATWNYWPRGYKVSDPIDNGVPGQINSASWTVDSGSLIVNAATSHRVYQALRPSTAEGCWEADFDGSTITFCHPTDG
jgi:hypothetical protein